jgi:drug/metabolite transporter (DMT)-like permease
MGLIQALVDEIIPFPKQADYESIGNKQMVCVQRLTYAFLNIIFQTIDCVVIPFIVFACFSGQLNFGLFNWIIIIGGGLCTIFSWFQCTYYFLLPAENYLNPITGRIFCETAIGAFFAALLRIKIITYIK